MSENKSGPRGQTTDTAQKTFTLTHQNMPSTPDGQARPTIAEPFIQARQDFERREQARQAWAWAEHQNRLDRAERRVRGYELEDVVRRLDSAARWCAGVERRIALIEGKLRRRGLLG
jgi:hypothetical protein